MNVTVGIAQFAPAVLDLNQCVRKACAIIASAGKKKINLLAFPETWIPVYPLWCDMGTFSEWGNQKAKQLHARLFNHSLEIGSKEFRAIT